MIREQYTTRFADGAPMQIEIGLDKVLAQSNGSRVEAVRVDLIGPGDAVIRASSGLVPYNPQMSKKEFFTFCRSKAYSDLFANREVGDL